MPLLRAVGFSGGDMCDRNSSASTKLHVLGWLPCTDACAGAVAGTRRLLSSIFLTGARQCQVNDHSRHSLLAGHHTNVGHQSFHNTLGLHSKATRHRTPVESWCFFLRSNAVPHPTKSAQSVVPKYPTFTESHFAANRIDRK